MNDSNIKTEEISFSVDNMLIEELGERLVPRDSSALSELIKNSYDADAKQVSVIFHEIGEPNGTIVIKDDGVGMDWNTIKNGWMRIGTVLKQRNEFSEVYKRPRTGSKGVGRFSCQRIANELELESYSTSGKEVVRISGIFKWDDFRPGENVEDRPIKFQIEENLPLSTPTGTELRLTRVKRAWSRDEIEEMRSDISSIVRPVPWEKTRVKPESSDESDPGMSVVIIADEYGISGEIEPELVRASWGYVEGILDSEGVARYRVSSKHISGERKLTSKEGFKNLGSAQFRLYLVILRRKLLGGVNTVEAKKLQDKFGGVRIFYDGFRVPSYGDAEHDWLELDKRRAERTPKTVDDELKTFVEKGTTRPMLSRPGNKQLFGGVQLSRISNPSIIISTSREAISENDGYRDLISFLNRGIDFLTVVYASYAQAQKKKKEPAHIPLRKAAKRVETARKKVAKVATGELSVHDFDRQLEIVVKEIQKTETIVRDQVAIYRILASVGTMVTVLSHDLHYFLRALGLLLEDLEEFIKMIPPKTHQARAVRELSEWRETIKGQVDLIEAMLGEEGRTKLQPVLVRDIASKLFLAYKRELNKIGIIKPENLAKPGVRTPPMLRGELYSILLNLLTNSMKALQTADVQEKKIRIESEYVNDEVVIRFLDTGPGVKKSDREKVFEPFYSTTEPDIDQGLGTGLGLNIVKDTLEAYNSTIKFVEPPKGWGAFVEIRMPLEVM